MFGSIGSLFLSLLGSSQVQSLFRTALKMGGTALILKAGGDPSNIDTVIGGVIAVIGMFNSGVAHGPTAA